MYVLKNGAVCWECDQRRNKFACKAKLPVLDDQIIKVTNDHTHAADRGEVQASKVHQEMKKACQRDRGNASVLLTLHFLTQEGLFPPLQSSNF